MRRIRLLHTEEPPTAELRALALRFPGSLREIDALSMEEIDRRIAALDDGDRERWMDALCVFHPLLRGALAAKRWLARRRDVDDVVREAFVREITDEDTLAWRDALASLARPPRGRIIDLVLSRVAASIGCSREEARALCLGAASAARAARRGW